MLHIIYLGTDKFQKMQVSVIIPTYNRVRDLNECLDSLLLQTVLPNQIIIVDNSKNNKSENLIKSRETDFGTKDVCLDYIKNERENSLTVARNIGVKSAKGEIILFLDDDVVLDRNYIKEILSVYREKPRAVGVQGFIKREKPSNIKRLFKKMFFLFHLEKNGCRVLNSISATYPHRLEKIITCEWLSGSNHSYKRFVLEEFAYDEKLKKYSSGEDFECSYRVFKKYPGALYITPYAKLVHKASLQGRVAGKELITMREVYRLYIFYKNTSQNIKNKTIYAWSRVGKFIYNIGRPIFTLSCDGLIENIYLIRAYVYCIVHIKEIKKGELGFFNKTLR